MPYELRDEHLVETEWLARNLKSRSVRVVDLRGFTRSIPSTAGFQSLTQMASKEDYYRGHISGAVYLDWTKDIVDLYDPIPGQLAPPILFARAMGRIGIDNNTEVIIYDNNAASQFATRLWWALRYYGHDSVRVLNGGWAKWKDEGRPVRKDVSEPEMKMFCPRERPWMRSKIKDVYRALKKPNVQLIDARDERQYSGKIRRSLRGGHIPGAINLPRQAIVSDSGAFRPISDIHEAVKDAGIRYEAEHIAYCNGGVASTTVLFALSMLGYPNLSNYDGSWNEWGNREDVPVDGEFSINFSEL